MKIKNGTYTCTLTVSKPTKLNSTSRGSHGCFSARDLIQITPQSRSNQGLTKLFPGDSHYAQSMLLSFSKTAACFFLSRRGLLRDPGKPAQASVPGRQKMAERKFAIVTAAVPVSESKFSAAWLSCEYYWFPEYVVHGDGQMDNGAGWRCQFLFFWNPPFLHAACSVIQRRVWVTGGPVWWECYLCSLVDVFGFGVFVV